MTKTAHGNRAHGNRLRIAVAMLAAALIALAGAQLANSALSDEAFPEDHAPMTFEKDGDIWVVSKMHLANLTPKSADSNETDSSVSPDGRKITFASDRDGDFEIYTVSVFGGEVRQVTGNGVDDRNPVWWPDGRGITYAAQYYSSPTHAGIFSTRVDDTDPSTAHGS